MFVDEGRKQSRLSGKNNSNRIKKLEVQENENKEKIIKLFYTRYIVGQDEKQKN